MNIICNTLTIDKEKKVTFSFEPNILAKEQILQKFWR